MSEPKRQNVRITVIEREQYDDGFPPNGLLEFSEWLAEQIKQIPAEHFNTAKIEIDSVSSWEDSHYASIKIYYMRPESDEEMDGRYRMNQAREAQQRAQELSLLHRLKQKYGD